MREDFLAKMEEAVAAFPVLGKPRSMKRYGSGHINDTFLTVAESGEVYILQRVNHVVFPHPEQMMENMERVTAHIRNKVLAEGGDAARATLTMERTVKGKTYYKDSIGCTWRVLDFVKNTVSRDAVTSPREFEACGRAFGHFQRELADFPAEKLHEVIPDFHNTPLRFKRLLEAVEKDAVGRAATVAEEIVFALERETFANTLEAARKKGDLPLRVTHNDTKLNNILFDATTGEPCCVIDLDTVMPGYSVNDFGDSIRFGANTAAEDEKNLDLVHFDLSLYRVYARGFLAGCDGKLTEKEVELMPIGARMMTYECGIRFLTDYLEGDVYFHTDYPEHNLVRARNQFKLLSDMEAHAADMKL